MVTGAEPAKGGKKVTYHLVANRVGFACDPATATPMCVWLFDLEARKMFNEWRQRLLSSLALGV